MKSSESDQTSLSLLGRIRQKDELAWSQLVQLYSPLVASWCYRFCLGPEETADVLQNFFLSVNRSIDQFAHVQTKSGPQPGCFRAWLWVIARNKIRDCVKLRKPDRGVGGDSAFDRLNQSPDPLTNQPTIDEDEPSTEIDKQSLLGRALDQIRPLVNEKTFQAFWRCVVDGQPTSIVAIQLEMTDAAVRQARSRLLRRLRQQMGDLP